MQFVHQACGFIPGGKNSYVQVGEQQHGDAVEGFRQVLQVYLSGFQAHYPALDGHITRQQRQGEEH